MTSAEQRRGLPAEGARDGWRNGFTAQMAEQIQADPVLLLETLDRINALAGNQTLARVIDQAGLEAAAAWYSRFENRPTYPDNIDWRQIGEHLLHRLVRSTLDLEPWRCQRARTSTQSGQLPDVATPERKVVRPCADADQMKRTAPGLLIALAFGAILAGAFNQPTQVTPSPSLQQMLDHSGTDLPFVPALASVSCPVERGPVKEGADADRNRVGSDLAATIAQLRARPKPSSYPTNSRVTTSEFHIWSITGYITQYKQESDGDIHLVVKDSAGRSLIAEMPYSGCVPTSSRWRTQIASARTSFAHAYSVQTSWHYIHRLVDLHGVGYMDPPHDQTGAAPNGLELHPVIYLRLR
jgi:hypothetical protein